MNDSYGTPLGVALEPANALDLSRTKQQLLGVFLPLLNSGIKAFVILGTLAIAPTPAFSHGERVPFADWGGFEPATASCQRHVLAATLRCARNSWSVRRRCLASEFAGRTCDRVATDQRITAIRRRALDLADSVCTERQLGELGFLGQFDLQVDIISGCRDWNTLLRSATYEPAAAADGTCVAVLDRAVTRAGVRMFAAWQRMMRRIAAGTFTPAQKDLLAARERSRQTRLAQRVGNTVAAACGGNPALAERAVRVTDLALCTVARVSVQDGILCPEPICGNGIIEPGELCDDGKASGDDPCFTGCGN